VFVYQPAVSALLPRSLFFLVMLAAMLSVRPFLGMSLASGLYMLPLQISTQLFATGVAYLVPHDAAFVSFVIFVGIFAAHWLDLPPGF
jgi:hypothetical protein